MKLMLSKILAALILVAVLLTWFSTGASASVDLLYFRAQPGTDVITLEWETATELNNLGFNIFRGPDSQFENATKTNPTLIPSQVGGQPVGAYYEWIDDDVELGITYYYWLQDVDFYNQTTNYGPEQASLIDSTVIVTQQPGGGNNATATPTSTASATATATPTTTTAAQTQATATPTAPTNTTVEPPASGNQDPVDNNPNQAVQPLSTVVNSNSPGAGSDSQQNATDGYPVPGETGSSDLSSSNPDGGENASLDNEQQALSQVLSASGEVNPALDSARAIGASSEGTERNNDRAADSRNASNNSKTFLILAAVAATLFVAGSAATILILKRQQPSG